MQTIAPHPAPPALVDGDVVVLRAIVTRVRTLKGVAFVHLRTATDLVQAVWAGALSDGVRPQAAVEATGRCVPARLKDATLSRQDLEVQLTRLHVLSTPAAPLPLDLGKPILDVGHDVLFDLRPLTLRHPTVAAIFTVQAALTRSFRGYLDGMGFTELRTPKIVAEGAEGGANLFEVDYFGRRATLAQSPQFYKEFGTAVFLRVYEVGPVFRAEKHNTSRHLNEYTSMDLELGPIASFEEVMAMQTGLLRHMMASVAEACAGPLALLGATVPEVPDIPALRFAEAKALIGGDADPDLSPAEEAALGAAIADRTGSDWVFVTHYPSEKRPFYAMDDPHDPTVTVSFDLLFRGVEVTTGGQRIHDPDALDAKVRARGLAPEAFAFFSAAHRFGLPPHGGSGMGLERLTQQLLGLGNVKEACLFPRDRNRLTP